jgi:hypothetical protein
MGVAGTVLAGAGRRGVGGALGAGVRGDRGLHELPTRHFERITMARVLLGEDRTDSHVPCTLLHVAEATPSAVCFSLLRISLLQQALYL